MQIVPADTEHHPFMSSFTVLNVQDQPDMLYVEDALVAAVATGSH